MPLSIDDLLDFKELRALEASYGRFDRQHYVISCSPTTRKVRTKRLDTRRGETLFLLRRADGRVLLHTKESYPNQAYRLPTGGVDWGESAVDALRREVREETGFEVRDERLLGLLTYSFEAEGRSAPFVTYVFLVTEIEGEPQPQDAGEKITGFAWRHPHELTEIAAGLRALPPGADGRDDWGRFRAAAHDYVAAWRE